MKNLYVVCLMSVDIRPDGKSSKKVASKNLRSQNVHTKIAIMSNYIKRSLKTFNFSFLTPYHYFKINCTKQLKLVNSII